MTTYRYFPMGFHTSTTANVNGIGNFLQLFADNNIPFVVKCVDGTTSLIDAQNLIKQGAEGHVIYRKMTGYINPPSSNDDVPHYGSNPKQEALRYWDSILQTFPADLDKNLVWIEIVNEPATEWADWLGELGYEIGQLALRDGYKILMFGWSTGTPEYGDWLTTGMRKYLTLCAENPDQIGISLHEYSLTVNSLFELSPYLVGRFQFLHDVCDEIGVDYPTIFVTEGGWEYNNAPSLNQMISELTLASALYGIYPNLKGLLIWALDKNWGDLDKKIYPLMWNNGISPLFNLVRDNPQEITDPVPPPTDETLGQFLERIAEENRVINYNTLAALELAMVNDDYVPYGNEKWETYDGVNYAIQGARRLGIEPPDRRVYYTIVGDWSNVQWIKQGSEPTQPEPDLVIHDIVESLTKHPTKTYGTRMIKDITTITIHHTVGISTPQNIASYHVNTNQWPGIGYHYVIEQDGKISMTNYPTTISYHAGVAGEQNNEYGLGISLVGNFTSQPPTQAQIESTRALVDYLKIQLPRAKYVLPHRNMPAQTTACPGNIWELWFDQITSPVILGQPVSIKFIPSELVKVTSDTLNVRLTPNGQVIASKSKDKTGAIQLDSAVNAGGFDWWRISWGDVVGWSAEDYLEITDSTPPVIDPPPPSVNKIDLLPYIQGNGVLYEVKNASNSQERFQSQEKGSYFLQTKNTRAESFFLKDGYIYRDWDTSPGNNRFYRLLENGIPGSPWIPQKMAVGEEFTRSRRVQFYNWNCATSDLNSGNVTDTMKFVAKYNSYTFRTGITLQDVIELHWSGGEKYFYCRGYGLVAWERLHYDPATPQWSAISEIHAPGQRPDNVVELPSCLS